MTTFYRRFLPEFNAKSRTSVPPQANWAPPVNPQKLGNNRPNALSLLGISGLLGLTGILSSCASQVNLAQDVSAESAKPQAFLEGTLSGVKPDQAYSTKPWASKTQEASTFAGQAQSFEWTKSIPERWWEMFGSPQLNTLVNLSLERNPNLAAANAALSQARANYAASYGALALPSVNTQLSTVRERASQATTNVPGGSLFSLYNASINVSYSVDLFGANKAVIEGQKALIDLQAYQSRAAQLSVMGNVLTAAIKEASLKAQINETQKILQLQEKQLDILRRQQNLGAIGLSPILVQEGLIAQTRSSLPALEKSWELVKNQITVLTGALPSGSDYKSIELQQLKLPTELPTSLPSQLIGHRPDILASMANLNQAVASLGLAKANLYPQINLTTSIGATATQTNNFFSTPWSFWTLGAGLTAPIFNGGALNARVSAAKAGYEGAYYQYKSTVLNAFENVSDALNAVTYDAQTLQLLAQAEQIANKSLTLSQNQYQLGAVNFNVVLEAQKTYAQARLNLISAQANRFADTVALIQAMGGAAWDPQMTANTNLSDLKVSRQP